MKKSRLAPARIVLIAALAGLMISPAIVSAQEDEPGRIQVRLVDVNSGGEAGWESAVKDAAATLKAAGRQFFHVYERVRGDLPGYAIITQDPAFMDLQPVTLDADVLTRLQRNGDGATLMSLAVYPELGISSGSLEPSGDFLYVRVRTVAPRNANAYFEWQRDELVPALREAGMPDLRSARVTLGGNINTFVRYAFPEDISGTITSLDIAGTVGQDDFDRIIEREADMLVTAEDFIYEFREDLSFTAE